MVQGQKASLPVNLNLPSDHYYESSSSSIPLIWARTQISDYMHEINTPDTFKKIKLSDDELKHKVTDLGLKYSLATRWTSFVAVSRKVVNHSPENSKDAPIPLPMVKGITYKAYPSILAGNMVGHSVPEPATVAGYSSYALLDL